VKRLLLVRHGQSTAAARGLTGGWSNPPLTDLGREQARRLAERLAAEVTGDVSLFSSDLERAAVTARTLGERLGVEPVLDPDLRELDNGAAAGLTLAQARALELPRTEPTLDWVPYEGAESWRRMASRVRACLDRLAARSEPVAIVVTHGNSSVAALKWWLQLPEETPIHFELDFASLSELTINEWGERTLVRLNDTKHLGDSQD
jgi:probable phosphoglycerate mutase